MVKPSKTVFFYYCENQFENQSRPNASMPHGARVLTLASFCFRPKNDGFAQIVCGTDIFYGGVNTTCR
jgi:hypothetical protein